MHGLNDVTTHEPFGLTEDLSLFSVNPGVPKADALEQAGNLMACVEAIAAARGIPDRDLEQNAIQYLAEASKAIVRACGDRAAA